LSVARKPVVVGCCGLSSVGVIVAPFKRVQAEAASRRETRRYNTVILEHTVIKQ